MKTYTIKLHGYCTEARIYELNQDAAEYWNNLLIVGEDESLYEYLEGEAETDDHSPEADFLNGEDQFDASSLYANVKYIDTAQARINVKNGDEEILDMVLNEDGVNIEWADGDELPTPALLVSDYSKGVFFQTDLELDDEKTFDKSKLKVILSEEDEGEAFVGVSYDGVELELDDFFLTGKGRTYTITNLD
jgi:hypothetical protein